VTTVHVDRRAGEVFVVTTDGALVDRREFADGDRFHPGGVSADPDGVWIALAEYRPRSTTTLLRLDHDLDVVARVAFDDHLGAVCPLADDTLVAVSWASTRWYRLDHDLDVVARVAFDDHLGAVCPLADDTLVAVSWASTRWYRLDPDGQVLDWRRGSNRYVDVQDLQPLTDGSVAGTGFGHLTTPAGTVPIGGVSVVDVDTLAPTHESPIAAWMPSGRPATYNATHLDARADGSVELHCLVDDTTADLGHWVTDTLTPTMASS